MKIPQHYKDQVGQKLTAEGCVLSKKYLTETEFMVMGVRWSSAQIYNRSKREMKHPCIEFLLKSKNMKRAQWSTPIAVTEIDLTKSHTTNETI